MYVNMYSEDYDSLPVAAMVFWREIYCCTPAQCNKGANTTQMSMQVDHLFLAMSVAHADCSGTLTSTYNVTSSFLFFFVCFFTHICIYICSVLIYSDQRSQ